MIRRPPRSTPLYSSAASDVYKRQVFSFVILVLLTFLLHHIKASQQKIYSLLLEVPNEHLNILIVRDEEFIRSFIDKSGDAGSYCSLSKSGTNANEAFNNTFTDSCLCAITIRLCVTKE
eukprot:TRINITY_DN13991_c0_g1_i10.p2 TRINITY_DN13991_c0_g1~~TRINITY_DN13991_c0_g1_i10.p2  ORF type:complete len:126 (+),score=22.87 TRINITY_DN13991_c0_g1_i10:23-379(+)